MIQRNVIASFPAYENAHSAASRLGQLGFGDVQVRILPPHTGYGATWRDQAIIVSAIVNAECAVEAERALADHGGLIDLCDDPAWSRSRSDDGRHGFRLQPSGRGQRDWLTTRFEALPWGAIAGAAMAVLAGLAVLRVAQDGAPAYRRFSGARRSGKRAPERDSLRPPPRSAVDEIDLAWGDRGVDDTAQLFDRPSGAGLTSPSRAGDFRPAPA